MNQDTAKRRNSVYVIFFLFIIIQMGILCYFGDKKEGYHVDEFFTYGLSNNYNEEDTYNMVIDNEKTYKGLSLFSDYFTVGEGEAFNYKLVFKNQALDVHPPLYYIIIHTICSFFPGQFSKWFGLIPNFICLIFIDFIFFILAKKLMENDMVALFITIAGGLTYLTLCMAVFIRMYALMTVFTLAITYFFVDYYNKKADIKFWIAFFLLTVCGTMTQYYFLIYLFFLCLFFEVHLLLRKQWKESILFVLDAGAAAITCILIFPAMLHQIFGGGMRGKEAFENFAAGGTFKEHFLAYYHVLSDEIFGGKLNVILIFIGLCLLLTIIKKINNYEKGIKTEGKQVWMMIFFVTIAYVLMITKISPYQTDRYIMPVGFNIVLLGFAGIYYTVLFLTKEKWRSTVGFLIMCGILAVNIQCLKTNNYDLIYTFSNADETLKTANQYKDNSAICVFKASWRTMNSCFELSQYKSYTFVKQKRLKRYIENYNEDQFILYLDNELDNEKILNKVLESCENVNDAKLLFSSGCANVYYLE